MYNSTEPGSARQEGEETEEEVCTVELADELELEWVPKDS